MIYGMIKKFNNKAYPINSFEKKLESLLGDIETLELYSLPSQRRILGELPEYLTNNAMSVGSGLYLATNESMDMVHCEYCWFFPIIKHDLKIKTIIPSNHELLIASSMHLNKMLALDEINAPKIRNRNIFK